MSAQSQMTQRSKWATRVIIVVVVLLVAAVWGGFFRSHSDVDSSKYQAVFLTNGQAYFGKLQGYGTTTPKMTDVYYFQPNESPEGDKTKQTTQTLIRLGDEIHKPDRLLLLNADAILFVENLSGEGSIVQAIEDNQ